MNRWLVAGFGLVLLSLAFTFRPVVAGDGVNYFAYLHSLVVDHDLDFRDEYRAARAAGISVDPTLTATPTATGLVANFQPVGSALMALPFYLAALALHPSGEPQFGRPFLAAFSLASLFYGLLALALSARLAWGSTGSRNAALAAAAVAALTTPLVFYLLYEPSYSHTFSAFAVSAFVLVWWRGRPDRSVAGWLALGLLGGLLGLVRIQDAPLAAIALLDLPRARSRFWPFVPGFLVGFAPQLVVDHVLFGTWLPYRPPAFALSFWPGHYLDVLLSSHNGLLTWSPVFALAALGLVLLPDRRLALAALVAFAVELLIDGSAPDWSGGLSFGMRRFLDLLPFVVVGLTELVRRMHPWVSAIGGSLLALWNFVLVANFLYVIKVDRDVGYAGLVRGQLEALRHVPRLLAQGGVVRALLLWRPLHEPFEPGFGLLLLALEGACLLAAVYAVWAWRPAATVRSAF
jgi:hypothetical protein